MSRRGALGKCYRKGVWNRRQGNWTAVTFLLRILDTFLRLIQRTKLRGLNLTNIPARVIKDLSKMVVLPEASESSSSDDMKNSWLSPKSPQTLPGRRMFTRIHTAPASTFAGSASLAPQEMKSTLSTNSFLGTVRQPMTMYLGQNSIKKLPAEMWTLQNLTVLSLRAFSISQVSQGWNKVLMNYFGSTR